MPGIDDFEFQTSETSETSAVSTPPRRRVLPLVVMAVGVAIIALGVYLWMRRSAEPPPASASAATATLPAPATATEITPAPTYVLPPVDDSDAFMRERFRELSESQTLTAWLQGTGLLRTLVVVLDNTSRGLSPARHLRRLAPASNFRTIQRGNRLVLDPRNYQRFTPIADAAASIDPAMAARLYVGIKPLLQMAYDELGNQESVDAALTRAMRQLLSAPIVEGDVVLEIGLEGTGFRFANSALESLPAVQKQMVRMGPASERVIQEHLRRFALAAGISGDALPPAQ
ncbi:MAG: DUF3014 domain-containing protein [Vicinamibacterales bacterium]